MVEDGLMTDELGKDVTINIDEETRSIIAKIKEPGRSESSSHGPVILIPRIRDDILLGNENYYRPRVVAIGPYHHEEHHLKAFEDEKLQCLKHLLERDNRISAENCFEQMRKLEPEARKCYPKNIELSKSKFAYMMMIDAGFIIELFMEQSEHRRRSTNLFLMYPLIKRDMLLLENQIPFFVLKKLFDLTIGYSGTAPPLNELAINFFKSPAEMEESFPPEVNSTKKEEQITPLSLDYVHHLLQLYHSQFYPDSYSLKEGTISSIPCATVLDMMGLKFKRASADRQVTDVNFNENKVVLEVPRLFIQEDTVALFFNLIAFEQFDINNGTQFTSYAVFMNYILSKAEDVEFLCQTGIIEHRLTNHEEVVNIFAKMCSGAFIDPNSTSLSAVLCGIKSYSESTSAVWQRTIWGGRMGKKPWWRAFFKDPITIAISLVGGVGLWVLAFLQTYYAAYGRYHSS